MQPHLLLDLLLDLLQVGSQVHGHLVFSSQQSLQHGVSRHTYFLQGGLLHAGQLHHLQLQILNLQAETHDDALVQTTWTRSEKTRVLGYLRVITTSDINLYNSYNIKRLKRPAESHKRIISLNSKIQNPQIKTQFHQQTKS